MEREKALDLIKKMLKLADNNAATDGEVQAALGRAAHLARKHNISDMEVQKAREQDNNGSEFEIKIDPKTMVKEHGYTAKSLNRWDKQLINVAAKAAGCGGYISSGIGNQSVVFYGLPTDVAVALELHDFCRALLSKRARKWAKEQRSFGLDVNSNSVEVRSYKDGFNYGLFKALEEAEKGDQEERVEINSGSQMALVPMKDINAAKKGALQAFARSLSLSKARRTRRDYDQGAFDAGQAAGRATNLSRQVVQ